MRTHSSVVLANIVVSFRREDVTTRKTANCLLYGGLQTEYLE